MKFFKHLTKQNLIVFAAGLCCGVLITAGAFTFFGGRAEPEPAQYHGSRDGISVSFTRYTDFKTFLDKKSKNIWIYNTEEEMTNVKGFIAGEVILDGHWDSVPKCNLKLVRKNGETVSSILLMNMYPDQKESPHLPFTTDDYTIPQKNLYKTAIVELAGKEHEIPLNLE